MPGGHSPPLFSINTLNRASGEASSATCTALPHPLALFRSPSRHTLRSRSTPRRWADGDRSGGARAAFIGLTTARPRGVRLDDRRRARCVGAVAADGERTDADGGRQDRRGATGRYRPRHARRPTRSLWDSHIHYDEIARASCGGSRSLPLGALERRGKRGVGGLPAWHGHTRDSCRQPFARPNAILPGCRIAAVFHRQGSARLDLGLRIAPDLTWEDGETSQRPWWSPPW